MSKFRALVVACGLVLLSGAGYAPPAPASGFALLELRVDGHAARVVEARREGSAVYVELDDIRDIVDPDAVQTSSRDGCARCVQLDAAGEVRILEAQAAVEWTPDLRVLRPVQLLAPGHDRDRWSEYALPAYRDQARSLQVGYSLSAYTQQYVDGDERQSGFGRMTLIQRLSNALALEASGFYRHFRDPVADISTETYERERTTLHYRAPQSHFFAAAGDLDVGATRFTNAYRIGGLALSNWRGEGIALSEPYEFSLEGLAVRPSVIELYVNGEKIREVATEGGRFALSDYNYADPTQLEVVITDELGQERVIRKELFAHPELLPSGADRIDFIAGRYRPDYEDYTSDAGLLVYRRGITRSWTGGVDLQLFDEDWQTTLESTFGTTVGLIRLGGALNGQFDSEEGPASAGFVDWSKSASYGRMFGRVGMAAEYGEQLTNPVRSFTQGRLFRGYGSVGARIGRGATAFVGAQGFQTRYFRFSTVLFGVSVRHVSLGANFSRFEDGDGRVDDRVGLQFSYRPGSTSRRYGVPTVSYYRQDSETFESNRVSAYSSFGRRTSASMTYLDQLTSVNSTEQLSASVSHRRDALSLSASAVDASSYESYRGRLSGGLVLSRYGLLASRSARLDSSYLVASAKGRDVTLTVNGRRRTIPEGGSRSFPVSSGRAPRIKLDTQGLPLGWAADPITPVSVGPGRVGRLTATVSPPGFFLTLPESVAAGDVVIRLNGHALPVLGASVFAERVRYGSNVFHIGDKCYKFRYAPPESVSGVRAIMDAEESTLNFTSTDTAEQWSVDLKVVPCEDQS